MNLTKPPMLQPGDTIAIVSPSWFGGERFVRRAIRGVRTLEDLGYTVKVMPHAFETAGHVSASIEDRLADLHGAFADPDVRMALCTIGGTHASDVLRFLDYDLIRRNPKIFMGFSDITALHHAIRRETGLVTFYGPGLLTDWAEYPAMPEIALNAAVRAIAEDGPIGPLAASEQWTQEFLDWETGEDETRERAHEASGGWEWIREGIASGPLVGGCLETMEHLRGTRWWPDFDGAIFFFETSEECPGPESFDTMLGDYANMGVLDRITGMLVSRPYGFDAAGRSRFLDYLRQRTADWGFPIVANMDFGHTSPMLTLPIGVRATINSTNRSVTIDESGVISR